MVFEFFTLCRVKNDVLIATVGLRDTKVGSWYQKRVASYHKEDTTRNYEEVW